MAKKKLGFELSLSGRDDGTLEAAYIHVGNGKVAKTVEVIEDVLMADYSGSGKLVGIEILAPVRLSQLTKLVEQPMRNSFKKFVESTAPQELVQA